MCYALICARLHEIVARLLRDCCKIVMRLLRECCKIVTRFLRDCFNVLHMLCPFCEIVERLLQDCCRIIANLLRLLQDYRNLTQPNLTQPYQTQPNLNQPNLTHPTLVRYTQPSAGAGVQGAEPPEACMMHSIVHYVGNFNCSKFMQ